MTWVAVMSVLFAAHMIVLARVLRILRERHAAAYEELGSPTLVPGVGPSWSGPLTRFLYSRAYRKLGDSSLTRFGDLLLLLTALFAACLVAPLLLH